eukprot:gnl/MRDRNA2_/MRDRNA2_91743_c0_seq1.p1 gnl/MRDRNA2_/MRDRNA2_91743_c0~~gnl/MRDRNA2_/MRDRNA2_91743_c0_seq1.p1  ORF type:complete len:115 (+),score=38.03 gnl/MRDRNA2_/MRDRNA2_91743_c0_seq1:96-440(+)
MANTANDSMHLRLKRKGATIFLLCYPDQPISAVKTKIGQMFSKDLNTFRLMYKDMVLDDEATIRAQQMSSNDVVHLVYLDEKKGEFENPEFDDLDKLAEEHAAKEAAAAAAQAS